MMTVNEIYTLLVETFEKEHIIRYDDNGYESKIIISALSVYDVCSFLKEDESTVCDSLTLLTAIDHSKDKTNKEFRNSFSVVYHLESYKLNHSVVLQTFLNREKGALPSVASLWSAANWHEREAYDMFGIEFTHHPDMRRILMPDDWEAGYPLRKDYQDPEYYNGMKVPYGEE